MALPVCREVHGRQDWPSARATQERQGQSFELTLRSCASAARRINVFLQIKSDILIGLDACPTVLSGTRSPDRVALRRSTMV